MSTRNRAIIIISVFILFAFYTGGTMNHATTRSGLEISLPDPDTDGKLSLEKAISQRRSIRSFSDEPLTIDQVSQIMWAAQGITDAQKNFRAAPSAGATYPLEVFLASGNIDGLDAGVYRYSPRNHSLNQIREGDPRKELHRHALQQSAIQDAPAVVVIGGVFERTTRRYGPRGKNYVYMEVGHAGQNIQLQAVSLGLGSVVIGAFDESGVQNALNLPQEVVPFYLIPVGH